jgi:hypothetical protein
MHVQKHKNSRKVYPKFGVHKFPKHIPPHLILKLIFSTNKSNADQVNPHRYQAGWSSGNTLTLVYEGLLVQILARSSAVLSEVFHIFP